MYFSINYPPVNHGIWPVPVAVRSKASICGRSLAGIVGSKPAAGMDVCRVLPGRGLCIGMNILPEESCRVWCV
jgi:hypothetical protein